MFMSLMLGNLVTFPHSSWNFRRLLWWPVP